MGMTSRAFLFYGYAEPEEGAWAEWGHDGLNYYCPVCDEGWRNER